MKLRELFDEGSNILEENGIISPAVDAFYLLEYAAGVDRKTYLLNKEHQVASNIVQKYLEVIDIRANHVPYQYIIGTAQFMGFEIKVTPDVLIPRFDTEILCEIALKLIPENGKVLDMCTGSGCISLAVKCIRDDLHVFASDISEKALDISKKNALAYGADITFIQSDLFDLFDPDEKFDCIISNPPYVTDEEYDDLDPEVKEHEPSLALKGGVDGMDIYNRLIPDSVNYLKHGGWLTLEIGCLQSAEVEYLMTKNGFVNVMTKKDLADLDRVVIGQRPIK